MSEKIIDLSHTISEYMTVYPGTEKPVIRNVASIEKQGYNELCLTCSTHTGTHIDAPSHILGKGKTLDIYNITTFFGKALVIDCTGHSIIERKHIENSLLKREIPQFLLIRTDWDRYWSSDRYFDNYPLLSKETTEFIAQLPLNGVGIDAPSYDPLNSTDLPNHKILLNRGFILVENLCRLNLINSEEIMFSCFPLKINRADASPIRAVVILQ